MFNDFKQLRIMIGGEMKGELFRSSPSLALVLALWLATVGIPLLTASHWRQVSNRVQRSYRGRQIVAANEQPGLVFVADPSSTEPMCWRGEDDLAAAPSPNHYESLSFLGNTKMCGVQDTPVRAIAH